MSWFLNALHLALGGSKKIASSIISKTFRGRMLVNSRKVPAIEIVSDAAQIKMLSVLEPCKVCSVYIRYTIIFTHKVSYY